jgi:hypothetical protein
MNTNNLIIVTDWEKVKKDDWYLSKEWEETGEDCKRARELQKEGRLFIGYMVDAKNYAIYGEMDSQEVFIDDDGYIVIYCESVVINNRHKMVFDCEF